MHNFLLDLWHDLREKRLWPIAVALLAATLAVPFVLMEKEQPAPAPAPGSAQGQTAADKLPTITLDEVGNKAPSNLAAFRSAQRNPFAPLKDLPKVQKDDENTTVERGSSDPGASSASAGKGSDSGSDAKAGAGGGGGGSG